VHEYVILVAKAVHGHGGAENLAPGSGSFVMSGAIDKLCKSV
jgi:hypothetical protein